MQRTIVYSLVALLTVGAMTLAFANTDATGGPKVGLPAPDFELADLKGKKVAKADFRGSPAVIVFWTAWCASCKEEAPELNSLARRFQSRGVRVLGINIQDSASRTKEGMKDFRIRYSIARDADAEVANRYSVVATPTIVLIDKKGIVRHVANKLPRNIDSLLSALIAE